MLGAMMMASTVTPNVAPLSVLAATENVTVTYEDGCNGEVFESVQVSVKKGSQIPDAGLEPTRDGFLFNGWSPSVTGKADNDVTYVAQWTGDDSLTDKDRKEIKKTADSTKSTVSVEDVNATIVSGKSGENTKKSKVTSEPTVTPNVTSTVEPTSESVEETTEVEVVSDSSITSDDDGTVDDITNVEMSGKQDVKTGDVKTGDMNMSLYASAAMSAVAVVGGACTSLMKRKKSDK